MNAEDTEYCDNCQGYGEVTAGDPDIGQEEHPIPCAKCEGTGFTSGSLETPNTKDQSTQRERQP